MTDEFSVLAGVCPVLANPQLSGIAVFSLVGEGFVDLSVAIVVFAVAEFGGGFICLVADEFAVFAGVGTTAADSRLSGVTRLSILGEGFIGLSVAVVVFAVAEFGRGLTFLFA